MGIVKDIDSFFLSLMMFTKKTVIEESLKNKLTGPQFGVLYHLQHADKMNMNELSSLLCQTHGATTGLVDRLVKLNMISRSRSDTDRRVVNVSITPQGQELVNKVRLKRYQILKNMTESMTEEEEKIVLKALSILTGKLENVN